MSVKLYDFGLSVAENEIIGQSKVTKFGTAEASVEFDIILVDN